MMTVASRAGRRAGCFRAPALASIACVVLALAVGACNKVPLLAPSSSTISVSAGTSTLPLGGSTEITAFVAESSGTPVQNGTTVTFRASMGSLSETTVQTRNGFATTTFSAGNSSGIAEIRATSGGIGTGGTTTTTSGTTTTTTTASNVVQVTIGSAATKSVIVTATPSTVPATGGTVNVVAAALDANGNRLVGVPVTFSTTAGTLSSSVATTDASGNASVTLTTNRAATVTALAGAATPATTAIAVGAATSVALAVTPTPGIAGQPVTLTVTPAAGTTPRVVVTWGDGTATDLGTVAAARGVTHTYASPGNYTITATATGEGDTFSTSVTETVNAAPGVTLTATPPSGPVTTVFSFTITPPAGSSARSVVVDFGDGDRIDLGAITAATTVTHRYQSAGSKTVRVTQTDANGAISTAVTVLTVT